MKRSSLCHCFALALLHLAAGPLRADLIFLKDGHVLQGKVRRDTTSEFDPISKDWIHTPKGFFAPVGGERKEDPDWQRFHLLGATNPAFFALNARRRIDVFGDTPEDFALVKVKNSKAGVHNPYARFKKEFSLEDFASSPIVSDPLRLLDVCATSDGAAALIVCTPEYAKRKLGTLDGTVRIKAVANTTPTYPQVRLELPDIATDSWATVAPPAFGFKDSIARRRPSA